MTELPPEDAPASAKPRTASLLKSMSLDTVTLDEALKLLSLPRIIGELDGEPVTAQNGRYGPYVKKGTDSRSLDSEEQLFTFTLAEAKDLFSQPKARGRARAAAPPLRELGDDPGTGKPMVVKNGRFGPYVTDGETNASLRKGDDVDTLTVQRAAELLADRRATAPSAPGPAPGGGRPPSRRRRKTATAKPAAKKPKRSGAPCGCPGRAPGKPGPGAAGLRAVPAASPPNRRSRSWSGPARGALVPIR